jgi:TRAP transporter TAXI family solute receptor
MTEGESFVFVSYSGEDEEWATWVAFELERAGLAARLQAWDSLPGQNYVEWINTQLAGARWTVALYSQAYFASEWCNREWTAALGHNTLLPLRLEPVNPPEALKHLTWWDLFGLDEEQARTRLLYAVGAQVLPRLAKFPARSSAPTPPPEFPGPAKAPEPPRFRRALITAVAAAVALLFIAGGTAIYYVLNRPEKLGGCSRVDIFTGHTDSPYYRYAQVLARGIGDGFPGTAVAVQQTSGTSDNINRMRDPTTAPCELAVIQLSGGVDARNGVQDFEGKPVEELRMVGTLWFDLIHVLVRRDSDIHNAADLCGKRVATGVGESGVKQIGEVLFRQVSGRVHGGCDLTPVRDTLPAGLQRLREGTVDAVLWVGGSPTQMIRDAIDGGLAVRLLPLDDYLLPMQEEWRRAYPKAGDIYQLGEIDAGDYPGVGPTRTVAIPNGVAVNERADDELVRFVAGSLSRDRADFEHALWGDAQGARHFLDPSKTVAGSPLYCAGAVPLHPAAASYYQALGVRPPC